MNRVLTLNDKGSPKYLFVGGVRYSLALYPFVTFANVITNKTFLPHYKLRQTIPVQPKCNKGYHR